MRHVTDDVDSSAQATAGEARLIRSPRPASAALDWPTSPICGALGARARATPLRQGASPQSSHVRRHRTSRRHRACWSASRRNKPDRRLPWVLMAAGQAVVRRRRPLWNVYEFDGQEPVPVACRRPLPRPAIPCIGARPAPARAAPDRRRGPGRPARCGDPHDRRGDPVVDLPHPAADGRQPTLDPLSLAISLAYPVADLVLDRGRHGPADHARAPDAIVPVPRREPRAGPHRRPDLRDPGPRRDLCRRRLDRTTLYLVGYLLFGAAATPSIDGSPDRAPSGPGHLARTGPA